MAEDVVAFASRPEWEAWLEKNHATASGVWIKVAKKGGGAAGIAISEVREMAELLIAAGKMRPAGPAAVEAARRDGRWNA